MPYNPHNSSQSGSVIGASNRTNSHHIQVNQMKKALAPRYGTIIEVRMQGGTQPAPFVRVRWIDQPSKESGWIPLEDHPNLISMVYAAKLEDLIGNYTVKVTRRNANGSDGIGRIVADPTFSEDNYDLELPSSGVKI